MKIRKSSIQYLDLILTCWEYAKDRKKHFVLSYILAAGSIVFILIQTSYLGKIINTLQTGGESMFDDLLDQFIVYSLLGLGFWAFHLPSRIIERNTAFVIRQTFTEKLYRIITEMPMQWHQEHHSGNTIDRVNKATGGLYRFADFQFMYVESICIFFGAIVAMGMVFPMAAVVVTVTSVLVFIMLLRFDKVLIKLQRQQNEREHELSSGLFDYISNIFTVITLRLENTTRREISRRIGEVFPPIKRSIYFNEFKWFFMFVFILLLESAVVLTYVGMSLQSGSVIMVGTAVVLYQYTKRINDTFRAFAIFYYELIRDHTNMTATDPILADYAKLVVEEDKKCPENWDTIKMENINFIHEDEKHRKHRLRDVSLTIKRGRKIALVGESGAGKSSLMMLMRGLYRTEGSKTFVDGKEFKGMSPLYSISTLVPQDPEIFENTIGYNITAGIPYDEDVIEKSIETACLERVIKDMPKGLDTDIREKGVNLSGGQKQRLALARGMLSALNRSLILLDEPTSSVDSSTEMSIYSKIFKRFADRCIISSVHRLHLLPDFDYIYVLENGSIAEQGTFEELLAMNGIFKKSWDKYNK